MNSREANHGRMGKMRPMNMPEGYLAGEIAHVIDETSRSWRSILLASRRRVALMSVDGFPSEIQAVERKGALALTLPSALDGRASQLTKEATIKLLSAEAADRMRDNQLKARNVPF